MLVSGPFRAFQGLSLYAGDVAEGFRCHCGMMFQNPGDLGWRSFFLVGKDTSPHDGSMEIGIVTYYMGVSKNSGTPKSSILIGFSIINHPFLGIPIFGNTIYSIS